MAKNEKKKKRKRKLKTHNKNSSPKCSSQSKYFLNFVYNVYIYIYFSFKKENSSLSNCNNEYVTQYANISCTALCTCTLRCCIFLIVFLWFSVFQSQKLDTFHSQVRELTKGNVITPPGKTRWTKPSDGSPLDSTRNIYHRNVHTLHTLC